MSSLGFSDWSWQSNGDLLLSGTGDILTTDPSTLASIVDMVQTRLKATVHAWKLYSIGAGLEKRIGDTVNAELEITCRRQVQQALTNNFLSAGSFTVQSLVDGTRITLFVYLNNNLLSSITLNTQSSL